jgi:hypothetical protein
MKLTRTITAPLILSICCIILVRCAWDDVGVESGTRVTFNFIDPATGGDIADITSNRIEKIVLVFVYDNLVDTAMLVVPITKVVQSPTGKFVADFKFTWRPGAYRYVWCLAMDADSKIAFAAPGPGSEAAKFVNSLFIQTAFEISSSNQIITASADLVKVQGYVPSQFNLLRPSYATFAELSEFINLATKEGSPIWRNP